MNYLEWIEQRYRDGQRNRSGWQPYTTSDAWDAGSAAIRKALRNLIDAADALDLDSPRPRNKDAQEAWLQDAEDFRQAVERARDALK